MGGHTRSQPRRGNEAKVAKPRDTRCLAGWARQGCGWGHQLWGWVIVTKGLRVWAEEAVGPLGGDELRQGSNTHNSEGMAQGLPSAVLVRLQGTGVGSGAGVGSCTLYNSDAGSSRSQEGAADP